MRKRIFLFAFTFSIFTLPALAQTIKLDMQPGLWENSFKMTGESSKELQSIQNDQMKKAMEEMKKQLANMPPEQRKQVEAMMAQSGVKIDGDSIKMQNDAVKISSEGTQVKQCITQAEIDRGDFPDDDENCKSTLSQISKNHFKATHKCVGENPSHGESEVVFDSNRYYSGKGVMTQTVDGKPHTLEIEMEGKWISSDCGDIKPETNK
jgi:Protein of unknown function (DUF3617)